MERPFQAYEGNDPYVFVCYSHDDRNLVYPEISRLRDAGFNIWYDEGITPGLEWSDTLASHIERCAAFLYFVSPRSVNSEHCRREVNYALEQCCGTLAVHLESTELPSGLKLTLSNRQAILKYDDPHDVYETKLSRAIRDAQRRDVQETPIASTLIVGGWTLDVSTRRLVRGEESHALDPKAQSVLLHLVDRAPEVVSREGLMARSWQGVVVGDNVLDQAITQLRRAFGDNAKKPTYIETLPRRGYRLLAPIDAPDGSRRSEPIHNGVSITSERTRRRYLAVGGSVLAIVVFLGLGAYGFLSQLTAPKESRIAVAMFDSPVGDDRLAEYASVFRDELVHHLARLARRSLVGSVDEADFVITGRLSEIQNSVRLYTQIVNKRNGTTLWSKPMELPREPTAEMLSSRPEHVANIGMTVVWQGPLALALTESEEAAYEYLAGEIEYMEATQGLGGNFDLAFARFERAQELDRHFLLPLIAIANDYKNRRYGALRYSQVVGPAHAYARQILEINPDATLPLGSINRQLDLDYEAALANIEHTRGSFPDSIIEFEIGLVRLFQGRLEDATEQFRLALRMGGRGNQASAYACIALAYSAMGRYDAALTAADDATVHTHGTGAYAELPLLMLKVEALYHLGRYPEAAATLESAWGTYGADNAFAFVGMFALLGKTEVAAEMLRQADDRFSAGKVVDIWALFLAGFYLGDDELAFMWLNRAIDERALLILLPYLRRSPIIDRLRDDSRFSSAMARIAELESRGTPTRSVAYP